MTRFRIDRLAKQDRTTFDCGNENLNRYLQRQAGQDQRKRYAVCFLAVEEETGRVAGYYTLSSGSLDLDRLPKEDARRLPRYPAVPLVTIGRLAVELRFQGTGLARWILADAYKRVKNSDVGAFALAVDAIDGEAESFYLRYGFIKVQSRKENERLLLLPIS